MTDSHSPNSSQAEETGQVIELLNKLARHQKEVLDEAASTIAEGEQRTHAILAGQWGEVDGRRRRVRWVAATTLLAASICLVVYFWPSPSALPTEPGHVFLDASGFSLSSPSTFQEIQWNSNFEDCSFRVRIQDPATGTILYSGSSTRSSLKLPENQARRWPDRVGVEIDALRNSELLGTTSGILMR
jgi:hypothetical protein